MSILYSSVDLWDELYDQYVRFCDDSDIAVIATQPHTTLGLRLTREEFESVVKGMSPETQKSYLGTLQSGFSSACQSILSGSNSRKSTYHTVKGTLNSFNTEREVGNTNASS